MIYRIAFGAARGTGGKVGLSPPAGPMKAQSSAGIGVPLVTQRRDLASKGTLSVRSASFADGMPIPAKHSEYADGVAPHLEWSAVEGAKSYAVIMEDPDSKPIKPFVHWVIWNIPGTLLSLPEGLQEQMRLTEPQGVLQGTTSRGSVGYFGPRPPVGDPPHHYHFQVLALDKLVDAPPGATRDEFLEAAKGHVIGNGVLVGTYQQTIKPPK